MYRDAQGLQGVYRGAEWCEKGCASVRECRAPDDLAASVVHVGLAEVVGCPAVCAAMHGRHADGSGVERYRGRGVVVCGGGLEAACVQA